MFTKIIICIALTAAILFLGFTAWLAYKIFQELANGTFFKK
jgi:hypothetical protein